MIVVERIKTDEQSNDKIIIYFQLDLSKCIFKEFDNISCIFNANQNEIKDSIFKTNKLVKNFEKIDSSPEKIEKNSNIFCYLFKVISIGPIYSLINTQFKSKLRADIKIEIIQLNSNLKKPVKVILALMSKNLFFYHFFLPNFFYLMKSDKKLEIDHSNKLNISSMIFIDDTTLINISKVKNNDRKKLFSGDFDSSNEQNSTISNEFKSDLCGLLIDKKIKKPFTSNVNPKSNIMDHFDLLIPNKEFKLIIKLDDQQDDCVTVFYDTRYSLHQLSILPGMRIKISNLIKKSECIFKSNSSLTSLYDQKLNFFGNVSIYELDKNQQILKSNAIYDKIANLNTIYESFYTNQNKIDLDDSYSRLNLIFKTTNEKGLKIIGQILKIYELTIRLKCKFCNYLADSCICNSSSCSSSSSSLSTENKITKTFIDPHKYKVEFNISFLIDDNTSLLRVNYTDFDFDLKSMYSNIFYNIPDYIGQILLKYLNELYIPILPINNFNDSDDNYEENLLKSIQHSKLNNRDTAYSGDSTNLENFFGSNNKEDRVKSDIYKTLYDFLSNTIISRYFVFNITPNATITKYYNQKLKLNQQFLKINEGEKHQLFKSVQMANCNFFKPLDNLDIMDL